LLPASAQALNVLDNDYFLPTIGGFIVFGIVASREQGTGAVTRAARPNSGRRLWRTS
jgi:hypothetical protein